MVRIIFIKGEFMEQSDQNDKEKLLYPHTTYHGQVKPENLVFNANLQEFSHKVGYITALQTGGKLAPDVAFKEIKELWEQLKISKKTLNINDEPQMER